MPNISIVKWDITVQETEAIVNAANPMLTPGGGISGQIHKKAGKKLFVELQDLLRKYSLWFLETWEALLTSGQNLTARYIIHTVGPKITVNKDNWEQLLAKSYESCLSIAEKNWIRSISFPSISTWIYGCPIKEASIIALETVKNYFKKNPYVVDEIRFVLFSDEDYQIYKNLIN